MSRIIILHTIYASLCLASSISSSSEETTREIMEHVLRLPNSNKVMNSVLDMLERNRQLEFMERRRQSAEENSDETAEPLPEYTESLGDVHERELRQLGAQKHYPICHQERKIRKLNTNEYEYRPAYYEEIRCVLSNNSGDSGLNKEICSSLGFSCVQGNKTIHLTRRRYSSECWETKTMVIPASCECMWPEHKLGDILKHI